MPDTGMLPVRLATEQGANIEAEAAATQRLILPGSISGLK